MPRRPKEKLYACPKCNHKYSSLGWMKRHLVKSGHSSTWIIYYNSDTILQLNNRIVQLEFKLDNLDLKNIIVKSSDIAIERIRKEMPKEKQENKGQFTIVIKQLNVIFNQIKPEEEHNIRPSELLKLKN
jgi:hypothetical protein